MKDAIAPERVVYICATKRGGVGKSVAALMLADMQLAGKAGTLQGKGGPGRDAGVAEIAETLRTVGREVTVVDLDVTPGQTTSNSALARRLGEAVTPFELAPSEDLRIDNALASHQHFDELGVIVEEAKSSVIDCGANVIDGLLDWAEASAIGEAWREAGIKVRFVAVAMSDRGSLEDAVDALERARVALEGCPLERFLVMNYVRGDFSTVESTQAMRKLESWDEVGVIHLPRCVAELWAAFDASNVPPSRIIGMTGGEVLEAFSKEAAKFASPRTSARRSITYLAGWYKEVLQRFIAAGLLTTTTAATDKAA